MEKEQNKSVQFGKYQILEELGRGGFGTVYKAQDKVLGRLVAIKILHGALIIEPSFLERFRQEARTAAMLDHPNLVPVHDFSETEGRYFIAMGYMPGGSLKELIKREGKLAPKRALEILEQVGAGLSYLHRKGVVHRDLKPGNILFDNEGQARVSDMGFAKLARGTSGMSMSASGGLVGTPAYIAPEIWRGKAASASSDVYSLACILVEILTGRVLFDGDSTPEVMFKHFEPLRLPEGLPGEWQPAIEKALEKEPGSRFENVLDFVKALRAVDEKASIPVAEKKQPKAPEKASETDAQALVTQEAAREQREEPQGSLLENQPVLEVDPGDSLKDELKLTTDELEARIKPVPPNAELVDTDNKCEGSETVTTQQSDRMETEHSKPGRKRSKRVWIIVGILLSLILCCFVAAIMFPQFLPGFFGSQVIDETTTPVNYPTQPSQPKVTNTARNTTSPTQIQATSTKVSVPTEIKKTPTTPPTKTPTTSPTKAPAVTVLETCKSDTRGLCILFFAESNKSLVVILRQENNFVGNYGMRINSSQYTCKVSTDNLTRMWCTGPMQPTNTSLPTEIYSYPPETVIASGNVAIPPIFYP